MKNQLYLLLPKGGILETSVIFIYCLADALVKTLQLKEDSLSKMSQAEIIPFVMISALFYQGNNSLDRLNLSIFWESPFEFVFSPGAEADIRGFHRLELDLDKESTLFADSAYTDYVLEDFLREEWAI